MNLRRFLTPRRLLPAAAVAALIAAAALVAGFRADRALRLELLQQARVAAMAINPHRAWVLKGTAADRDNRHYTWVKHQLAAIRSANPQYRFLYLMTRRPDGAVIFLVDSEPDDSPNLSPPGQVYAEASPTLRAVLDSEEDRVEGPSRDPWGIWVSALVHLPRPAPESRPILLGVDIPARRWLREVAVHAALPASLAALVILTALGALHLLRSRRRLQARQAELARSEQRYEELAVQSRTLHWEIDSQGRFSYVSPAVEAVLGIAPESLVGSRHFFDLYPPGKRDAFKQDIFERFSRREIFREFEHPVPVPGGGLRWLSSNGMPRLNPDGSLLGYRGFSSDVTERRQAREELRSSEIQKKAILDNIPLHVLLLDKSLQVRWANRAAADSVGQPPDALVGKPCHAFWADPDHPCEDCPGVAALRSGQPGHGRVRTPDGRIWDERAAPIFDANGRLAGVVEIAEDITERSATEEQMRTLLEESSRARRALLGILEDEKAAEEKLQRQTLAQQLLIRISFSFVNRPLDTVDDAIQDALRLLGEFTGSDRAYLYEVNPDQQTVRNSHEWCAEGIEALIDQLQEVPWALAPEWQEAHTSGRPMVLEDIHRLPPCPLRDLLESQSVLSLASVPLMEDGQCIGFLGLDAVRQPNAFSGPELDLLRVLAELLVNVHLRRRGEQQRAMLETRLSQARKMESIGRLAGGIAHDFNNMIQVILSSAELARMAPDLSPALKTELDEIHDAARRSRDITRQLLALGRRQTGRPRVLDLNQMVAGTLQMLRRLISENIDLRWTPADGLWPVLADPSQIDQILTNLCLNARDAITGTGHLDIAAANCSLSAPPPRHPEVPPGDYVRLSVRDDGPGIDPELLDHLFEPFFTTKDPGKGTGLGLPMVFGIVRQHNGFIDVESETGRGTAFHIHLPRHAGKPAAAPPPPPPPPPRGERKTILLVEDEPSILAMTASVLDSLGYTVRSAVSPADAIRLAREDSHPIHLLLTDIIMPGMNGRDLAQTLCALRPGLRVLYMSGYPAEVIARNGVLDSSLAFIPKPFNRADLAAKLHEILGE